MPPDDEITHSSLKEAIGLLKTITGLIPAKPSQSWVIHTFPGGTHPVISIGNGFDLDDTVRATLRRLTTCGAITWSPHHPQGGERTIQTVNLERLREEAERII